MFIITFFDTIISLNILIFLTITWSYTFSFSIKCIIILVGCWTFFCTIKWSLLIIIWTWFTTSIIRLLNCILTSTWDCTCTTIFLTWRINSFWCLVYWCMFCCTSWSTMNSNTLTLNSQIIWCFTISSTYS